jgi:hypothetical protein
MSEFSEIILTGGVVLLGAWGLKKYFDTWQPETWQPTTRTCIGPICWSQYGPQLSQQPGLPGGSGTGGGTPWNPLDTLCNWPGSEYILPPCSYKLLGGE